VRSGGVPSGSIWPDSTGVNVAISPAPHTSDRIAPVPVGRNVSTSLPTSLKHDMSAALGTITARMKLNFFAGNEAPEAEQPAALPPSTATAKPPSHATFPADEVVWGIVIRNGFDELDDPLYHRGTTQHAYLEGHDNVAICGFRPPQSGPRSRRRSRLGLPSGGEHPMCGMCARMVVAPRPRVPVPVQGGRPAVAVPVARPTTPPPPQPVPVAQAVPVPVAAVPVAAVPVAAVPVAQAVPVPVAAVPVAAVPVAAVPMASAHAPIPPTAPAPVAAVPVAAVPMASAQAPAPPTAPAPVAPAPAKADPTALVQAPTVPPAPAKAPASAAPRPTPAVALAPATPAPVAAVPVAPAPPAPVPAGPAPASDVASTDTTTPAEEADSASAEQWLRDRTDADDGHSEDADIEIGTRHDGGLLERGVHAENED